MPTSQSASFRYVMDELPISSPAIAAPSRPSLRTPLKPAPTSKKDPNPPSTPEWLYEDQSKLVRYGKYPVPRRRAIISSSIRQLVRSTTRRPSPSASAQLQDEFAASFHHPSDVDTETAEASTAESAKTSDKSLPPSSSPLLPSPRHSSPPKASLPGVSPLDSSTTDPSKAEKSKPSPSTTSPSKEQKSKADAEEYLWESVLFEWAGKYVIRWVGNDLGTDLPWAPTLEPKVGFDAAEPIPQARADDENETGDEQMTDAEAKANNQDAGKEYDIREILGKVSFPNQKTKKTFTMYLVDWEAGSAAEYDSDIEDGSATEDYKPTWEPKWNVSAAAIDMYEKRLKLKRKSELSRRGSFAMLNKRKRRRADSSDDEY